MNDRRDLGGLHALVTGATSGLGRATAEALARRGADVIVHGRNLERGAAVADAITAEGGKARFIAADLNDLPELEELARQAGQADILVNNAGFSWFGPTADLEPATFDEMFAANVRSAYYLVAALAPRMARRGNGCVINLGSMAGQIGPPAPSTPPGRPRTASRLLVTPRCWPAPPSPRRLPAPSPSSLPRTPDTSPAR
jgi:NAD(P)-dependent dehydrogenase (short-subunit alcohol dehydrogenase family)